MGYILLWSPLAWTVRVLLLVHAGGILYISALYLARFLRPTNALILISGGLPDFRRVEGSAKVLGQELTINADLDETKSDRIMAVEQRIEELEICVRELTATAALLTNGIRERGENDG